MKLKVHSKQTLLVNGQNCEPSLQIIFKIKLNRYVVLYINVKIYLQASDEENTIETTFF